MAKKVINKIYGVVNSDRFCGYFETQDSAEEYIISEEMAGAHILEIVKVTESDYPEEPEMEFWERNLIQVLED